MKYLNSAITFMLFSILFTYIIQLHFVINQLKKDNLTSHYTQVKDVKKELISKINPEIIVSWLDESEQSANFHIETLNLFNEFTSSTNHTINKVDIADNSQINNKLFIIALPQKQAQVIKETARAKDIALKTPNYWETLYSIESKQGKKLYRPRNKAKSCIITKAACGHHQLTAQALKDIGCKTKQCKADREDFNKSLAMSKALDIINNTRLAKKGYRNLPEYQKYLIHQQGASGISKILDTLNGKKLLNRKLAKNMANNSPYSYKKIRRFGSRLAAKKFLAYWENKWKKEKDLLLSEKYSQQLQPFSLQVASN